MEKIITEQVGRTLIEFNFIYVAAYTNLAVSLDLKWWNGV